MNLPTRFPEDPLMKRCLDECYWSEYGFEGYVNHEPKVIFLACYPTCPRRGRTRTCG
jgi:hypothetical protein